MMTHKKAREIIDKDRTLHPEEYEAVENAVPCERCGRLLTDPESIKRGIGPECLLKGILDD